MEKKRKEKARSGKTNKKINVITSPVPNTSQVRNNENNQNYVQTKKILLQPYNDNTNDEIPENVNKKSAKTLSSKKQAKNASNQKPKLKNNSQKRKSNQNSALSPTNLISRSHNNNSSYINKNIDLNERSDIEDNFRSKESLNNFNQDNSLSFSPIQKKEIISSPPPTPYNNTAENDIKLDANDVSNPPDNFNSNSEGDEQSGNNSSFTQLITSKCDLKAELQAAIQVNKQLKERDAQLQKRIAELNHQSQIAHQVLEDRLSELREENIHLNEILEQLPSDERLIIEYTSLTTFPIDDDNIEPLIKIGILEEGENMSVLRERLDDLIGELKYYESLYDIVARYGEDGFMTKFFLSYFDDSYTNKDDSDSMSNESNEIENQKLAYELKHKIDILMKSSDISSKLSRKKVAKLEKEIDMLRKDIQEQQAMSSYQPSESSSVLLNQTGYFSLQEVQTALVAAGGDSSNLKQASGNTFSYKCRNKEITFDIEAVCGRPYVTPSEFNSRRITLFSFFKSIV